ncbi:MAG: MBL fold metallo-hydrolase [Kiritimatiellae bacterium]|nr:MBL fold metallo-hydrolase [Kiritimatiellia bacterium]
MISNTIIKVGAYEVNCAVLWNGNGALVVDPGQDAESILGVISEKSLELRGILLTHGHFDHVNGIPGLLEKYPEAPVYMHPADWVMFGHPMNRNPPDYPGVDRPANLCDIRKMSEDFPSFGFEVMETPGHTPGSVCIKSGDCLFSGDTLFAGSCGRTDFPGGSMADMRKSLAKLAKLDAGTKVLPGHGPATTIGYEVANNPFM